ncbi:MAG: hypothetical protein QMB03_08385, partial [Spirosomataceae bacterium]
KSSFWGMIAIETFFTDGNVISFFIIFQISIILQRYENTDSIIYHSTNLYTCICKEKRKKN